jgi:hypothetical protein
MRYPAVSGLFYPSSSKDLKLQVENFLQKAKVEKKERIGIICPHAGYIYSGSCAAYSFASCSNFKKELTAIIVGPNHTGMGLPIAVSYEDWQTPIGLVKCDLELAKEIVSCSSIAKHDEVAHLQEHSCEVQIPFLQLSASSFKFVSICMGWQDKESAKELANAIYSAAKNTKRNILLVASSDFTHYEPAEVAQKKDMEAIQKILSFDAEGFEDLVEKKDLSICGHGPIATAIFYSKFLNAKKAELLKYTNSGETSGDFESVVAYASIAIS